METEPPSSEKQRKIFCKCPQCKGEFIISSEMLESKLLCPHCKSDVTDFIRQSQNQNQNDDDQDTPKTQLPPPRKEKIHLSRKISRPVSQNQRDAFEDRDHTFVPADKETKIDKVRLKKHINQEKSSLPTFFLILGAIGMLAIAGVFYYKIIKLPDITKLEDPVSSLLIDNEDQIIPSEISAMSAPGENDIDTDQNIIPLNNSAGQDFLKRQIINKQDLDTCLENLQKFCKASTAEEKSKYVFASEETITPMNHWAKQMKLDDLSEQPPLNIVNARLMGKLIIATVALGNNTPKTAYFLYDDQLKTWLLDWFSWVQYQKMTYEELMRERPQSPVLIRVNIGMAANYQSPFDAAAQPDSYQGKSYVNIDLRFDDSKTLRGYVDRSNELSIAITKNLMSGTVPAIISVSFPPESSGAKPDQVIISDIIRIGWLGDAAQETYIESTQNPL